MLFGKTVVLATNQLQFVASADKVLYIAGGRILESGTYADLLLAGGPFAAMMKEAQVRACFVLKGNQGVLQTMMLHWAYTISLHVCRLDACVGPRKATALRSRVAL